MAKCIVCGAEARDDELVPLAFPKAKAHHSVRPLLQRQGVTDTCEQIGNKWLRLFELGIFPEELTWFFEECQKLAREG